ncbi:MAG TPA: B-box zinc finger protein [Bryocella sp.]|nr:B-box zinc finger protein [Bryocella sp.]
MSCANHPEAPAVAYCRTCGKPLCNVCAREVNGVVYCAEHVPAPVYSAAPPVGAVVPPPGVPPPGAPNPKLAAILGCIPGVGAMYNGEFAKGFVHVLIFATLIWMSEHASEGLQAFVGLFIAAFFIYMPIEAYKTARARQFGLPAPDPFGINNWFRSGPPPGPAAAPGAGVMPPMAAGGPSLAPDVAEPPQHSRVPVGAVILIGLGVLFLLDEMDFLHFDRIISRFWPLILIALGVRILMQRQRRGC